MAEPKETEMKCMLCGEPKELTNAICMECRIEEEFLWDGR